MKALIKSRAIWSFAGVIALPTIGVIKGLISPSAFQAMRHAGMYEEFRREFSMLQDYTYSLRYQGDSAELERFAKETKLGDHKKSETLFEYESEDGQFTRPASLGEDGWITYQEVQF